MSMSKKEKIELEKALESVTKQVREIESELFRIKQNDCITVWIEKEDEAICGYRVHSLRDVILSLMDGNVPSCLDSSSLPGRDTLLRTKIKTA